MESMYPSSTLRSARRRSVHFEYPSGESPQASAIICASTSPVTFAGTCGVSRFLRTSTASRPFFCICAAYSLYCCMRGMIRFCDFCNRHISLSIAVGCQQNIGSQNCSSFCCALFSFLLRSIQLYILLSAYIIFLSSWLIILYHFILVLTRFNGDRVLIYICKQH